MDCCRNLRSGIVKIDAGRDGGYLKFSSDTRVDPLKLVELVQHDPQRYRLPDAERLSFRADMPDGPARADEVRALLACLRCAQ